jgi:glutamate synthase domain-containing protein 1
VRQVFIAWSASGSSAVTGGADLADEMAFERKLFVIRRLAEKAIRYAPESDDTFYIASLSCQTIVYKGMLTAVQVEEFYPDLHDPALASAIALVHSRFSTNAFPSWARAQPFRSCSFRCRPALGRLRSWRDFVQFLRRGREWRAGVL